MSWLLSLFSASESFNPITSFIRIGCILVLVAGAWYIDHLRGEVKVLEANNQTLQVANQQDAAAIAQCNAATQALQQQAKTLQTQVAQAKKDSEAQAQVHFNKAKTILEQSKVQPKATDDATQLKQINDLFNSLIPSK